jgi:hypothetical protein
MDDKWSIKKVLKSQGDVHEKVVNQSRLHTTSVSDVLHMHGKLRT